MGQLLRRLRHEEEAATAVEYAIIAALVGVGLIGALIFFRNNIRNMFNRAGAALGQQ